MANPKRRHSNARTGKRRAHDSIEIPAMSECPRCHSTMMPHRVCERCGFYRGREVKEPEE